MEDLRRDLQSFAEERDWGQFHSPKNLASALTVEASELLEVFQWLTEAQGATLSADWLSRSKRRLPINERRHLSALSDELARQIGDTLSREAGLYTAHEMMEALDPNYHSEIAESLMAECERLLDANPLA